MLRSRLEFKLILWLMLMPGMACIAQRAAITGLVRDASGVAQLGVMVQVTTADSSLVARAFTDLRGHYLVSNLAPGLYRVQATAALFAPTIRPSLQLRSDVSAVVNLTMSTIFDATSWLPAERRRADEPPDDWTWTLRSAANRPILRMVEDGQLVMVSSSATESHAPSNRGRADMSSGDGGFGHGGAHSVLTMDSAEADGSSAVVRADTGSGRTSSGVGPSTDLSAGFERQTGFASTTRVVTSFQSHPEMAGPDKVRGLQTMQLATAQRTRLGDTITLEGGGVSYAVHTVGYGFVAEPFLRVLVEPFAGWSVGYRMATSRDLQGFSGLNAIEPELPIVTTDSRGRVHTEKGSHQEIAVTRKLGHGQIKTAIYQDGFDRIAIAGSGLLTASDMELLNKGPVNGVADTMTGSFRLLAPGYQARGFNAMATQPLGGTVWAAVEYSRGAGLASVLDAGAPPAMLPIVLSSLKRRSAQSATLALNGKLVVTGTKLRSVYRWQPASLVTAVDAYREFADQPFLGVQLHQAIHCSGLLPPGLEVSVDMTNLLAQGYQPFLSSDGRTLYLSQTPRTLQAGLSINF